MYLTTMVLAPCPLVKVILRSTYPRISTCSPEKPIRTPSKGLSWPFDTCRSTKVSQNVTSVELLWSIRTKSMFLPIMTMKNTMGPSSSSMAFLGSSCIGCHWYVSRENTIHVYLLLPEQIALILERSFREPSEDHVEISEDGNFMFVGCVGPTFVDISFSCRVGFSLCHDFVAQQMSFPE